MVPTTCPPLMPKLMVWFWPPATTTAPEQSRWHVGVTDTEGDSSEPVWWFSAVAAVEGVPLPCGATNPLLDTDGDAGAWDGSTNNCVRDPVLVADSRSPPTVREDSADSVPLLEAVRVTDGVGSGEGVAVTVFVAE